MYMYRTTGWPVGQSPVKKQNSNQEKTFMRLEMHLCICECRLQ